MTPGDVDGKLQHRAGHRAAGGAPVEQQLGTRGGVGVPRLGAEAQGGTWLHGFPGAGRQKK